MSARADKGQQLVLGDEPRVDLLPPEVHARAKMHALRRMLGLVVVLAVVVVAGGYLFATIRSAAAEAELSAAQDRTLELLAEQGEYSEASAASDLVDAALTDRVTVVSNEVPWADVIDAIRRLLPPETTLDSATMTARSPWAQEMVTQGPLRAPRVATITFDVKSPSLLDTPAVVRALATIPGYADATPDLVVRNDTTFITTITLNLNAGALTDRYADEKDESK
jgi:hypothetical protein